ncbi:response regulator [Microbacterium sp. 179-I 3D2 NHS]|uniref:response regulator n=1 Tax=Microbacterium sp. 179-I 3D2 NHS TaxID=3235178 RepID=UPI0039A0AA5C
MPDLLLIEDDAMIRRGFELALARHGHTLRSVESGEQGLEAFESSAPDLVVLDLMLPGIDGIHVCRRIREKSTVPVIVMSARGDDFDIVSGLEAGADDYVTKPVQPTVLDARIRAVLRRSPLSDEGVRTLGDLRIDTTALTVTLRGSVIDLTPTELRLLLVLSRSPAQVFSRQQLLELVWEHDYLGDSRLVDNGVQRLRAKIEDTPSAPRYVQTVRGFGYRFGPL